MPNHDTNYVAVIGPVEKLERVRSEFITPNDDGTVSPDFNVLIPMPHELSVTSSPPTVVATQDEADKQNAEHKERWPAGLFGNIEYYAIAEDEAKRRLLEYGALDWYAFASNRWGTKWNAYSYEHEKTCIVERGENSVLYMTFDTAWAQPTPVLEELARTYDVRVACITIDEGGFTPEVFGDPAGVLHLREVRKGIVDDDVVILGEDEVSEEDEWTDWEVDRLL